MTVDDSRFRYWRDPICVCAAAAYGINRWLVPGAWQATWWHGHFADVLMIPAGLPLWLWLERRLGWRGNDCMPRFREIVFALCTWTVAAELMAPRIFSRATGDTWDAVAYTGGALVAGLFWRRTAGCSPTVHPCVGHRALYRLWRPEGCCVSKGGSPAADAGKMSLDPPPTIE
jgi:hypothetical protein